MKKVFYLFLALLFINTSCSVKKRSYRPGYYVDWVFNKEKAKPVKHQTTISKNDPETVNEIAISIQADDPKTISFSEENVLNEVESKTPDNTFIQNEKECGDIIKFKDGSELTVMVMDVTETEVEYKLCNNLKGKLIIAEKKDIASIKYLDGTLEDFEKKIIDETLDSSGNKKKMHPMAWLIFGFTIGIIALLVLAAGTVAILAPIAEKKTLKDQDNYRGLKLIRICEEISISFLILVAAAIVLFALYMLVIFLL